MSFRTIWENFWWRCHISFLLHRSVRAGAELRLAGVSGWWGEGVQWSVSAVISSVSKVLASPTSTITTHTEMLSSSDTWQHLSTSWTSSYYFTSSATSPSSRANPSCWLAEMPTLTPSDTFGLGCREWERAWGISCQGVWHMRNWFDCYKLPLTPSLEHWNFFWKVVCWKPIGGDSRPLG